MILKEDIASWVKPSVIYGRQGEEVNMISDCGKVLIVEGKNGNRFPVYKESVTLEAIAHVTQEAAPDTAAHNKSITNRAPVSRKKAAPIKQNTLF